MMGVKQRSFAPIVNVSLEDLVPQDHFYRHLERTLDLSFVRHAVDRLSVLWYLGVRHVTHCSIPSETERTRRRFFGSRAYLAPKGNGNHSMLLKQDAAKAL